MVPDHFLLARYLPGWIPAQHEHALSRLGYPKRFVPPEVASELQYRLNLAHPDQQRQFARHRPALSMAEQRCSRRKC